MFKFSDHSSNQWYVLGTLIKYMDHQFKINLGISSNFDPKVRYLTCNIDCYGNTTIQFENVDDKSDSIMEYVNFIIDSILEYFKS